MTSNVTTYLQSKMIRMPLNLNERWNNDINSLSSVQQIIDYIDKNGTTDEHWRLLHAIRLMEKLNNKDNLLKD